MNLRPQGTILAKKKEEPKKPLATQLIFQAPDLPTPVVNPRSGKPADEAKPEPKKRERTRKEDRCTNGPDPVFDGHLSGAYMDFLQLDATSYRYGDHSIRSDWNDLGALYLGYPDVDVHCNRTFGDDGDYYQ